MPDSHDPSPVIAPHDAVAAYESAYDVLVALIGFASTRIDEERQQPAGNPAAVEEWLQRRQDWSSRWRSLRPSDTAAVRRVLSEDAAVLRSLSTG